MSGPNLVNQIVGVTTRFHEEPVAVIGDIESIFRQVLIPEKDRSLLRFLWRQNHNTSSKILDFEMNVHVFEGTSSPSCCNYVLKKTALGNKINYHPDVALTLKKKFYVDDLLKSLKDVSTAVKLIQDVSKMCSDGGFRLTKLISNEVQVLSSIPTEDIRRGVKNVNISGEVDLPTEKSPQYLLEHRKDTFGFKTNLDVKSLKVSYKNVGCYLWLVRFMILSALLHLFC